MAATTRKLKEIKVATSKKDKKQARTEKGANHWVHVFVYGSLKKGLGNHSLLTIAEAEFVGFDSISGQFSMISYGGFPAACHNSAVECAPVFGEVYRIHPEALPSLDALEGHPEWYRREKLMTDVNEIRAWIYLQPESALTENTVADNLWRPKDIEVAFWTERGYKLPVKEVA